MELTKGLTIEGSYGLAGRAQFTPYYFDHNNKFIANLITNPTSAIYHTNKGSREELAAKIKNLRKNNYQFLCFHCGSHRTPLALINWIKEKKYTLEIHGQIFRKYKKNNYTDFHGNIVQVSNAFHFRIYDEDLLKIVRTKTKRVNKKKMY